MLRRSRGIESELDMGAEHLPLQHPSKQYHQQPQHKNDIVPLRVQQVSRRMIDENGGTNEPVSPQPTPPQNHHHNIHMMTMRKSSQHIESSSSSSSPSSKRPSHGLVEDCFTHALQTLQMPPDSPPKVSSKRSLHKFQHHQEEEEPPLVVVVKAEGGDDDRSWSSDESSSPPLPPIMSFPPQDEAVVLSIVEENDYCKDEETSSSSRYPLPQKPQQEQILPLKSDLKGSPIVGDDNESIRELFTSRKCWGEDDDGAHAPLAPIPPAEKQRQQRLEEDRAAAQQELARRQRQRWHDDDEEDSEEPRPPTMRRGSSYYDEDDDDDARSYSSSSSYSSSGSYSSSSSFDDRGTDEPKVPHEHGSSPWEDAVEDSLLQGGQKRQHLMAPAAHDFHHPQDVHYKNDYHMHVQTLPSSRYTMSSIMEDSVFPYHLDGEVQQKAKSTFKFGWGLRLKLTFFQKMLSWRSAGSKKKESKKTKRRSKKDNKQKQRS